MVGPGDIVPYEEMSRIEGKSLQKGMNFRPRGKTSVFLMSRRPDALYDDELADGGRTLVYTGHDDHVGPGLAEPSLRDQPLTRDNRRPSDNAKFLEAAENAKRGAPPFMVHVWEKLERGVWCFNGTFELRDAWRESDGRRHVFKFQLKMVDEKKATPRPLQHDRVIPSPVKAEVWKRDGGRCVLCGSDVNIHFDHELPFSKGGTSLVAANVRILCAKHNLAKGDRIE